MPKYELKPQNFLGGTVFETGLKPVFVILIKNNLLVQQLLLALEFVNKIMMKIFPSGSLFILSQFMRG